MKNESPGTISAWMTVPLDSVLACLWAREGREILQCQIGIFSYNYENAENDLND